MQFYIQLATSFIVGGLFIALQTLIAERVSLKWRGIALTVPTTMALGILFIAITKSPAEIPEVAKIMPAALAPSYIFVLLFALLIKRFGVVTSMIIPYITWGLLGYLLIQFPPPSYFTATFIYALPLLLGAYLIIRKLPQKTKLKIFPMNWKHILARALIGGSIIALAVFLAKTAGNFWGGLFSMFPASYSATFIIYYHLQGPEVMPSVARSLFWPGIIGFILYGYIASLTFPEYGMWIGTLAAYAVVLSFFWGWVRIRESFKT